jgi:hypothetical protein
MVPQSPMPIECFRNIQYILTGTEVWALFTPGGIIIFGSYGGAPPPLMAAAVHAAIMAGVDYTHIFGLMYTVMKGNTAA